jgi:hypothetical protein
MTVAGSASRPPDFLLIVAASSGNPSQLKGDQTVAAALKLTHKAIGAEVRRNSYEILVDGRPAGSVTMNDTTELSVEPGRHTVRIRDGRNSSGTETFDASDGETVAFRCTGKRFLPIFLASFVVPSLALKLKRE